MCLGFIYRNFSLDVWGVFLICIAFKYIIFWEIFFEIFCLENYFYFVFYLFLDSGLSEDERWFL